MNELLQELADLGNDLILLWSIVFFRVTAVMAVLPGFGERSVPVRVRLALSFAFTTIVAPIVAPTILVPPNDFDSFLRLALPEIATGLLFGLGLRLFVLALQIAGSIAAQSTSLSQIFGGSAGVDPQPAMGHLLNISGLALLAILGFHVIATEYLLLSFELVPAGEPPLPSIFAEAGVQEVARCFSLGFVLAAPFLVASLIYNVTLGVINRAMPQLMVAFVGAPAITAGGLILLFLSAPLALSFWVDELSDFVVNPFGGAP